MIRWKPPTMQSLLRLVNRHPKLQRQNKKTVQTEPETSPNILQAVGRRVSLHKSDVIKRPLEISPCVLEESKKTEEAVYEAEVAEKKMKLEVQTELENFRVPLIHKRTATKDINKSLEIARERLMALTEKDVELDEPISVCKISFDAFLKHSELFPSGILYENGYVKMWEFPHGQAGGEMYRYIDDCTGRYLKTFGDQNCLIRQRKTKTPDDALCPSGRQSTMANLDGDPFPTIVLEYAGKGQGIEALRKVLRLYFTDFNDIQIVIGLKVSKHKNGKFRIIFMITIRQMEDLEEYEIGEVGPNRETLTRDRRLPSISLPFDLVFHSAPIAPELTAANNEFSLDLNVLSDILLTSLKDSMYSGIH